MKRIMCMMLLISIILTNTACISFSTKSKNDAAFYYLSATVTYGKPDSLIGSEPARLQNQKNIRETLASYFHGPTTASLVSPFPSDVSVLLFRLEENTVFITLSQQIDQLSDVDLIIACTCLAKTVFSLTGTEAIQISAENGFTDIQGSIILTQDNIALYDHTKVEPSED